MSKLVSYLDLAYDGNYVGRVGPLEYWTHKGKVYMTNRQQPEVIQETNGVYLFLLMK